MPFSPKAWALAAFLIFPVCIAAFAQTPPQLYVQTAHADTVASVAFSPDGQLLASGSSDQTIKLWSVASGQELRTLAGHGNDVAAVAFSPDGHWLASASHDGTIKFWDVNHGRLLRTIEAHADGVNAIAFGPDGRALASAGGDEIKLWDTATGEELRAFKGHAGEVHAIAFNTDGKRLASGGEDKTIRLWDVASGAEGRMLAGHLNAVRSVVFSVDGRMIASGSEDKTIKLWDAATGQEMRTLAGDSSKVNAVAFSPDGHMLASGHTRETIEGETVKLWDTATGQLLRTLAGHSNHVFAVAFNPAGTLLASGSADNRIKLWNPATGQLLRTHERHSDEVRALVFSRDRKTLACGSADGTVKLWDVTTDRQLRALKGHSAWITAVAFNGDGNMLASASSDKTVKLWNVAAGQEIRALKGHTDLVTSVAFSPDGRMVASASYDKTIRLWNAATGQLRRTLAGHLSEVLSIAFSPDGRLLASGGWDGTIRWWDTATGRQMYRLEGHSKAIHTIAFSPDGKLLASGSDDFDDNVIQLWDVVARAELRTIPHAEPVASIAFNHNGEMLAVGSQDGSIQLWEVATGRELKTLTGHSGWVMAVAFIADGRVLASGSRDTTIKLWETATGKELATLAAVDEDDWLVATPDGLFDGSPATWSRILWRFSPSLFDVAPVEIFFSDFFYPGLLTEIVAGKHHTAPSNISKVDRRQPQVNLSGPAASTARIIKVKIEVVEAASDKDHPAGSGARDLRLFRNGSLVKAWHEALALKDGKATLEASVPIIAGENKLTAYAFNHDNVKSGDAALTVTGAESLQRTGSLTILAIGIDRYANADYDLRYAVADARAFAEELLAQQQQLKTYQPVAVISLLDREATRDNILLALKRFARDGAGELPEGAPAALQAVKPAEPEDAIVIYFAGHGTAAQARFYLIPHDLGFQNKREELDRGGLDNLLAHSISDKELEQAFEGIDAGQMLLVIDACNSGQALEAEEKRRAPMNSQGLAQLAYEKGMYILTAAQSYQAAQEVTALGHGLLTYALVENGLKRAQADRDGNGEVTEREWLDYATERVPQMQLEKQRRKRGVVVDDGADAERRNLQRPRLFYRRESEAHPLIVAKKRAAIPIKHRRRR